MSELQQVGIDVTTSRVEEFIRECEPGDGRHYAGDGNTQTGALVRLVESLRDGGVDL